LDASDQIWLGTRNRFEKNSSFFDFFGRGDNSNVLLSIDITYVFLWLVFDQGVGCNRFDENGILTIRIAYIDRLSASAFQKIRQTSIIFRWDHRPISWQITDAQRPNNALALYSHQS